MLLTEMDFTYRRGLAKKADRLWARKAKHRYDVVAAIGIGIEEEDSSITVATVSTTGRASSQLGL